MPGIFLSYRREDSAGYAGRLSDDLRQQFGPDVVFTDIDTIEPGLDFVKAIEDAVDSCNVLLVMIGRQWLTAIDSRGRRRLDDPHDFVRLEVASALRRQIRVIPILVQNTPMPGVEELPEDLTFLTRRQAFEITDTRWKYDVHELIKVLGKIVASAPSVVTPGAPTVAHSVPTVRVSQADVKAQPVESVPSAPGRSREPSFSKRFGRAVSRLLRAVPYLLLIIFGLMLATGVALLNSYSRSDRDTGAAFLFIAIIGIALEVGWWLWRRRRRLRQTPGSSAAKV